jgi:ribose transport system substrate-binding protein
MRRSGALVVAVAAAVTTLAACSSASAPTGNTAAKPSAASSSAKGGITIGFANPQDTQPVLQAFQASLTAAAAREGDHVISLNAGLNVNQQVSDIETLTTDKVKAIIVFPLAGPALVPALTQARKAGIKLIGYNALTPGAAAQKSAAPFDTDLDQGIIVKGAHDAASYVQTALHGKGNVLGINIAAPVPSLDALVANYKVFVTAGHPDIHWLGTAADQTDSLSGGQTATANAITRYGKNINAIMSYTDEAAIGAAHALQQAGIKNTVIVGQQGNQDGINALKAGLIQGDIDVQPWKQGLYALAMAKALIAGKSVPVLVQYPPVFITKANVASYVPWNTAIAQIKSGKMSLSVTY